MASEVEIRRPSTAHGSQFGGWRSTSREKDLVGDGTRTQEKVLLGGGPDLKRRIYWRTVQISREGSAGGRSRLGERDLVSEVHISRGRSGGGGPYPQQRGAVDLATLHYTTLQM